MERSERLALDGANASEGSVVSRGCTFVVHGTPAPQGSKKFVGFAGGRGRMVESSKAVEPWREDVRNAALRERDRGIARFEGAVVLRMVFTLAKPKSAPRTRRTWPSKKPDLDKLMRSTCDALTQAGLLADDARIVDVSRLAKVFPGEDPEALQSGTGVVIVIDSLEERTQPNVVSIDAPKQARDLFA